MREVRAPRRAQGRVRPHQEGVRGLARARIRILRLREEGEIQSAGRAGGSGGLVAERPDLHKGRCGHRRIDRGLRRDGIAASERRALAVMRELGLQARGRAGGASARRRLRWAARARASRTGRSTSGPAAGYWRATSPASERARDDSASQPRSTRSMGGPWAGRCPSA